MVFLFEVLAPMFGGMISQLYQDGKIQITKATLLVWLICFLCFTGNCLFDKNPFHVRDIATSFVFSCGAAAFCAAILYISKIFKAK